MRVFLTGAEGFLGKHVYAALEDAGHSPFFFSKKLCNVLNAPKLYELLSQSKPDAVIHLAAVCGGIQANQAAPARFWHDNLAMGLNVLSVCNGLNIKKLIMMGTTCSYPRDCKVPFVESDLFTGYPEDTNAPYGIAKRALVVGAQAYRKQYGLDVVTLIPTNLYGEYDHFEPERSHVIPALIKKIVEAEGALTLWGTGKPTRDFVYAKDCAQAIALALDGKSPTSGPVNLGSGQEVSIKQVAEMIAEILKWKGRIVFDKSKPDGQPRRCLDTTQARTYWGWEATTPLKEGLRKTIEWYLMNRESEKK
jgi:GDP-L-fucose synthase